MRMQWVIVLEISRIIGISLKVIDRSKADLSGIGLTRACCLKRMGKKCGAMAEIGGHPVHQAIIILIVMVLLHLIVYGILMAMKCEKFINISISNLTAQ